MYRVCRSEQIILASASPRRKEFLSNLGIQFLVEPANVDESFLVSYTPSDNAKLIALSKARSVSANNPSAWIIAADTIVVCGGQIFGKPVDLIDAQRMLRALSGRSHAVLGGVAIVNQSRAIEESFALETIVNFRHLSEELITAYCESGESSDKAGAYGIQGLGGSLVASISGSYSNVVGLPLVEVLQYLEKLGVVEVSTGE